MAIALIEGICERVDSFGKTHKLSTTLDGVKSGWAFIGNPYWEGGDPHWRMKDGETVIGCSPNDYRAMPVADAYMKLHELWEAERAEMRQWEADWETQRAEAEALLLWESTEELYRIQDALAGV